MPIVEKLEFHKSRSELLEAINMISKNLFPFDKI